MYFDQKRSEKCITNINFKKNVSLNFEDFRISSNKYLFIKAKVGGGDTWFHLLSYQVMVMPTICLMILNVGSGIATTDHSRTEK